MDFARGVIGVLLALILIAGVCVAGSFVPEPIEKSVTDSYFYSFPAEIP